MGLQELLTDIQDRIIEYTEKETERQMKEYPIYATVDGERVDVDVVLHGSEIEVKILGVNNGNI